MDYSYFLEWMKDKPSSDSLLLLKWLSLMTTFTMKVCRSILLILTDDLGLVITQNSTKSGRPSVSGLSD